MDVNLFFPARGDWDGVQRAKAICASCPVSDQCLTEELLRPPGYDWSGIFGGTTSRDRQELRKRLGVSEEREHRQFQPCGTPAAYKRHRRNGEPACEKCLAANRVYVAKKHQQRAGAGA